LKLPPIIDVEIIADNEGLIKLIIPLHPPCLPVGRLYQREE
jgi:hypothetical protein